MIKNVHISAERFLMWMVAARKKSNFENPAEISSLSSYLSPLKIWNWLKACRFFSSMNFAPSVSWTWKMLFLTNLPEEIPYTWVFSPKFGNDRKLLKFFEKILSFNCSSRHRECTFDTPGSKFFPEDKTSFCSKPKEMNKIVHFSAKSFLLKVFAGHEKWKLDNYAELNSLNSDLFFAQSPKRWTKMYAVNQNKFSSNCLLDRRKAVLTMMPE